VEDTLRKITVSHSYIHELRKTMVTMAIGLQKEAKSLREHVDAIEDVPDLPMSIDYPI
jgi:hypothetical protein